MTDLTYAEGLAQQLPVCGDDEGNEDLISLCDIVITGIEVPGEWHHFGVTGYNPDAKGTEDDPWAVIAALKGAWPSKTRIKSLRLTADVVRAATTKYLQSRLDAGMDLTEASRLVDGSYTDAVIADSILQFALYGEEVFG